jgi:hypothetical protein
VLCLEEMRVYNWTTVSPLPARLNTPQACCLDVRASIPFTMLHAVFVFASFACRCAWQHNVEAIGFMITAPCVVALSVMVYRYRYDALRLPQEVRSPYSVRLVRGFGQVVCNSSRHCPAHTQIPRYSFLFFWCRVLLVWELGFVLPTITLCAMLLVVLPGGAEGAPLAV